MTNITITEALAEIPTIGKRIEKKQQFIMTFLYRQSAVRDPNEKEGGSAVLIQRELQAIKDLQTRLINIRSAIQKANAENIIEIGDKKMTIADWLTWRREVVETDRRLLNQIVNTLSQARQEANRKGVQVIEKDAGAYSADYVVNVNEREIADKIENIEYTLGVLDGQLSLKNATIVISVP